jgi:hypothetical protein
MFVDFLSLYQFFFFFFLKGRTQLTLMLRGVHLICWTKWNACRRLATAEYLQIRYLITLE